MPELSEVNVLVLGLIIFLARVLDVSVGTVRTLAIVQGRMMVAFVLGFVEVCVWLYVITAVVQEVAEQPILVAFYALGFSTGNVVGIWAEKKLAMGHIILRIITYRRGERIARAIREMGFRVTVFQGRGARGPVNELYVVCDRRDFNRVMTTVQNIQPDVFYITETPGQVRRFRKTLATPVTGWRSPFKRK